MDSSHAVGKDYQFHQHFMSNLCADIIALKNCKTKIVTREKLRKTLLYEKGVCKMLMKLSPIVNFINILRAAFVLIFLH
jgi:hypothetical protein